MFSFSLRANIEEELLSHEIYVFNSIRNCETIFQNYFTMLHSYWQCMTRSSSTTSSLLDNVSILILALLECGMVFHCGFNFYFPGD